MKYIWVLVGIVLSCQVLHAQRYQSEKSSVIFFSDAAIEDIKAENLKSTSDLDLATGQLKIIIKNIHFEFDKALMKEHFNEKYMETERYRESTFEGLVSGFDLSKAGSQSVIAKGKLKIHGQTKEVEIPGTMELRDGKILAQSKFMVKLHDYKIKIPQLLWQNIAEEVQVTIDFTYKAI